MDDNHFGAGGSNMILPALYSVDFQVPYFGIESTEPFSRRKLQNTQYAYLKSE